MKALRRRAHEAEQLDNLHMSGEILHQTLDELSRINRLIGNTALVCRAVLDMAQAQAGRPVRIVDLGCGGGDVLLAIAKTMRAQGIPAQLLGIEGNPHSVAYARQRAGDLPELRFETQDILGDAFVMPECDIAVSSHFLYHFSDQRLGAFLEANRACVHRGWVISELHRSAVSYQLFRLIGPLLGLRPITRADGLLAIRRAFRRDDLEAILRPTHMQHAIRWIWSFRYLITLYPRSHG